MTLRPSVICSTNYTNDILFKSLRWVTTLDFPITFLKTFELGSTLFQGPKEAILPESLSHSSIYLAVSMTVSESLIKLRLTENCKESSGFFIAPVHTGYLLVFKAPVILFHPGSSLSLG
uniref:Uncharacterized protein n=1 Tax=Suricata suricatta TaxID=37032 RepID=A0A673VA74_SURSU